VAVFFKKEQGKLKFLWGWREKLIAVGLAFVLVLSVGIVGVISAISQNARFQTRVSFIAKDVAADIYMKTTHVGGDTGATDIDVNMSGNIASVDSGDTNYGVYRYKAQILPNTPADSINATAVTQELVEMGTTKTLPDGATTYTSFVKYEFKVVNNSSKNLGVRFTYYFNDNGNQGTTYNNLTLGFKALDNTGTASTAIVNGVDILATGNTSSKYGTSSGYATFVLWVRVAEQAFNADTSNIVINIALNGADETNAYDGTETMGSLASTRWAMSNTPNTSTLEQGKTYALNFTSNGEEFVGIERGSLIYVKANGTRVTAYSDSTGWANVKYKTITITGGSDATYANLIAWIYDNGTQQAINSLVGTKWLINEAPAVSYEEWSYNINFVSNGEEYNQISRISSGHGELVWGNRSVFLYAYSGGYIKDEGNNHWLIENVVDVIDMPPQSGWQDSNYRTIYIYGGEDADNNDLWSWLQNNATQVQGADITFTIDGNTYHAESGMNWHEWVLSDYNTGSWQIFDSSYVATGIGGEHRFYGIIMRRANSAVLHDDLISSGDAYITMDEVSPGGMD